MSSIPPASPSKTPPGPGDGPVRRFRWMRGKPGQPLEENEPVIDEIAAMIKLEERVDLMAELERWDPADLMELMVQLPLKRARILNEWLSPSVATKVLAELNPRLRAVLMRKATVKRSRKLIQGLDEEDAHELLQDLPEEVAERVLNGMEGESELRRRLEYDKESAGGIMSRSFVAVPESWTVGKAVEEIRRRADSIQKFYAIFVVDEQRRLVGLLKLRDLMLNPPEAVVSDIMRRKVISVSADMDQEEVERIATQFELPTIPVVDGQRRLVGKITGTELAEVVREEAEEDMKLMSGVSPDSQADEPVMGIVRGRLPWLVGGLVGASLAAVVVGSFEGQLERAAILASFIPVVMAMAGNAGIQASTVTVQGLTAGTLWIGDLGRRIVTEMLGALVNGLVVSVLLGVLVLVADLVFGIENASMLALSAALSLTTVTMLAAVIGSSVPLILNHFKIDPAMATGVFITTSNDILGVLVFFLIVTRLYLGA